MRFGIYHECGTTGQALGGAEYVVAVLASALAPSRSVEIVHHREDFDASTLESFSSLPLKGVTFRGVPRENRSSSATSLPWRIWEESRSWHAHLSEPYDVFVNVTHGLPPFCHAHHGVLVVLFPLYVRAEWYPWSEPRPNSLAVTHHARMRYYEWEWQRRFSSYDAIVSISEFTRRWTQRYWDIDSSVVYPPVGLPTTGRTQKTNTIINVGRFATSGHRKHQAEVIQAFSQLTDLHTSEWTLDCLGALGASDTDRAHFEALHALLRDMPARLRPNVSRADLLAAYDSAKIFVHAAGLTAAVDRPDAVEHFGISTVEAMNAGCVPVVINRGGQPEIVQHGVSGFVWNTVEEMQHYIRALASDDELCARMSEAARDRARLFSHENFIDKMFPLLGVGRGATHPLGPTRASAIQHAS